MQLEIISPDGCLFKGEVTKVSLPGEKSAFTVLNNHAPIISSLLPGKIVYATTVGEETLKVEGGFVEVQNNVVTLCVEKAVKI